MPSRLTLSITLLLLLPLSAAAQVRTAPAGNELPAEAVAPALPPGHSVDDGHDHGHHPGDGHGHAPAPRVMTRAEHRRLAERIDLDAFRKLAVFDTGRVKIIDTLAREQVQRIYGKPRWRDAQVEPTAAGPRWKDDGPSYDPVFTYLDLLFNESYYYDKPLIYVEVLALREALIAHLPPAEQELWKVRGRLTPMMAGSRRSIDILRGMDGDLLRQKASLQVQRSLHAFATLDATLNIVSPPAGTDRWAHLAELADHRHASAAGGLVDVPAVADPEAARAVREGFERLAVAWRRGDADTANAALAELSRTIPRLNPQTYPEPWRGSIERLYNATHRFTIGYVGYLLGAIALLIAFAVGRRWLIVTGIALLGAGFAVHSAGMLVRGLLSGRWPIHNQYESFIAVAWLAVLAGIILMLVRRQWLFGAAAAAVGAASLLFANTVDIPSREAAPVAGILATSRILYVHVNMVLLSYGLIGLGFFISLFYLGVHYLHGRAVAQLAAGGLGVMPALAAGGGGGSVGGGELSATSGHGITSDETDGSPARGRQALLNDLDRAQMVVLQLAFWILGVGILLGAYWADHAWGRWWAWDPKETWALITWIIYLAVIHLRFAVKRRGLVTAWLSVLGFGVMLWTYWGVNLLLAGLHSYA